MSHLIFSSSQKNVKKWIKILFMLLYWWLQKRLTALIKFARLATSKGWSLTILWSSFLSNSNSLSWIPNSAIRFAMSSWIFVVATFSMNEIVCSNVLWIQENRGFQHIHEALSKMGIRPLDVFVVLGVANI